MAQVNMVQTAIAVHNLHGPDKNVGHRHGSIEALLDAAKGGIGGFNEFNHKDLPFIKAEAAKRGLSVQVVGLNGIVWDPTKFRVSKPRVKKIMQGGHVGADGTRKGPDNRRVGPSRFGLYFDVLVIAINFEFELDATHLMARAFTLHKWRQGLFRKSVTSLGDGVLLPDGILFGDMNSNTPIDMPGVADVYVKSPADMGRQHYTQIHRWGRHIYINNVTVKNTPSDHHLLVGKVTFYREPQDKLSATSAPLPSGQPKPAKLPQPGDQNVNWKKYGSPVAHPWADRPIRFRRRRKKLWNRIVKWRTAYRRRL